MKRANFIGAPQIFNLNQACSTLTAAFGHTIYLVGSAIERRDYRDVDVRCILDDVEYDRMFPGLFKDGKRNSSSQYNALWSIMCSSISLWLAQASGLPVDFQIQRQTEANSEYPNQSRHPLGIWLQYDAGG
jgi:hypothetical protein